MPANSAERRQGSGRRRAAPGNLDVARLLNSYRTMLRIRAFEEAAVRGLDEKLVLGAIHPSIGQEAVAVGVCANLTADDFISSTHRGFHHASFEVPSIDAIAVGADRMRAKGHQAGWGLGRHTIGSNFFHYNPDPWGSWIEWFSDIDQIDDCWVAGDWDVPPHLWGAPPPETFLANSEPAPTKE